MSSIDLRLLQTIHCALEVYLKQILYTHRNPGFTGNFLCFLLEMRRKGLSGKKGISVNNSPRTPGVSAMSGSEGTPEGISLNPDIVARRSEGEG